MKCKHVHRSLGLVAAAVLGMVGSMISVPTAHAEVVATWVRQIGRPGHAGVYAWGAATALDGSILVGDYNNYNIKRYTPDGQLLQVIGKKGTNPGQMNQPYGLAVDPVTGDLYLADTISKEIEVFHPDGTPKATWDVAPTGGYYTSRLAVNHDGWVYAVNSQQTSPLNPHYVNVYDRDGQFLFRFGSTGTGDGETRGLRAIAIGPNDEVYVVDAGNRRVQVFDRLGGYLRSFGGRGQDVGQFGGDMRGIALDQDNGWAYVSDASDGTIEKFTLDGTPLATFTVPGPETGGEEASTGGPRELTVGQDHTLYVMDYAGQRVVAFSPDGELVRSIPENPEPAPDGGFNQPEGIAIDQTTGQVYVTDTFNHRIQRFSADGAFEAKWGYRGRGTGEAMDYPRGIAVDPQDGSVWLNNTRSANIKHYAAEGGIVGSFGSQGPLNNQYFFSRGIHAGTDGQLYVADSGNQRLKVISRTGSLVWSAPCGAPSVGKNFLLVGCTSVDRDAGGNVYAAAPTEDVVYKFSPTGTLLAKLGGRGVGPGQFRGAYGVAIRGERMYVSEMENNRISVLTLDGDFVGTFGGPGTEHGQFRRPTALAFDPQGRLYVSDTSNERVEVFDVN
jgi:tripartite motif-containing protein 71